MYLRSIFSIAFFAVLLSTGITAEPLSKEEVNVFDRSLMFPYSEGLDVASDVTQYTGFLVPAIFFAAAPASDFLSIGVMYTTSSILALGTGTALKQIVDRDRPYMYFNGAPEEEIAKGSSNDSFPSRHTAMAFSGAAFTITLFALKYPQSKLRIPATALACTLAGTTAALRIAGGSHFMTDVIAGAAIGSFSGFIVPYLATKLDFIPTHSSDADGSGLSVTPLGVMYTHTY